MTILFESPNVFYAVIDGVNIRIENPEILPILARYGSSDVRYKINENYEYLKPGDIFQVEGFEYEVNNCNCVVEQYQGNCQYPLCKRAILKLAKEEEPKEQKIDVYLSESDFNLLETTTHTSDVFSMMFKKHETLNYTKKVTLTWKK